MGESKMKQHRIPGGEPVLELTPYAGERLRPRPWPVGPNESYGKVDFHDGEGETVLTVYVQRGPEEGYVLHVEHLAAPLRVDGTLLRLSPAPHVDRDARISDGSPPPARP